MMGRKTDTLNTQLYERLKRMLIDYRFRPGEPLVIGVFADALRSSATPVRESLIRLHTQGHVTISPGRGFCAKTLSGSEMLNVIQLQHLILSEAI